MTHVSILATPTTWDGIGLRLAIHDWLRGNAGRQATDMTDYVWGKVGYHFKASRTKINPMYVSIREEFPLDAPIYLHFLFKDEKVAMMFKLAWAGV